MTVAENGKNKKFHLSTFVGLEAFRTGFVDKKMGKDLDSKWERVTAPVYKGGRVLYPMMQAYELGRYYAAAAQGMGMDLNKIKIYHGRGVSSKFLPVCLEIQLWMKA